LAIGGLVSGCLAIALAIVCLIRVPVLLTTGVPYSTRLRETSHVKGRISNLRNIDRSKAQWALELHNQNTDTPTASDIQPYTGDGTASELPVCPNDSNQRFDTSYSINNVGIEPTWKNDLRICGAGRKS